MNRRKSQALGSIFDAVAKTPAPPPAPPAKVSALLVLVDRLESVLDAETEALRRAVPADIAEIGNRKRQGLLEMDRALRAFSPDDPWPEVRERLARFAGAIERNRAALGTQLRAVREIADIIGRALQDAESDGTYSIAAGRA